MSNERVIKFQFLYKGLPFSHTDNRFNWHKKVYTLDQLMDRSLSQLSDVHAQCDLIAKRQYTGLKDKNGVEIYEGDIVIKDGKPKEVIFSEKAAKFCVRKPSKQWHGVVNKVYSLIGCDVIGNIHENPELLEDKE